MNRFIEVFFKRPPVIFPLVALFLIGMAIMDACFWLGDKRVDIVYWLKPSVTIVYAVLWIYTVLLRKWAATAFVIVTIIHLLVFLFMKEEVIGRILDNGMVTPLPINIAFSIVILFYYRKMKY